MEKSKPVALQNESAKTDESAVAPQSGQEKKKYSAPSLNKPVRFSALCQAT